MISEPVLQEFEDVIFRKKFDKYFVNDAERLEAINRIEDNSIVFFPKATINACRDPKDNKFLELAIVAGASCIISGDKDLLILNPFQTTYCTCPRIFAAFLAFCFYPRNQVILTCWVQSH
jgi:putative PIN family toxin of toxin-antitoxin system